MGNSELGAASLAATNSFVILGINLPLLGPRNDEEPATNNAVGIVLVREHIVPSNQMTTALTLSMPHRLSLLQHDVWTSELAAVTHLPPPHQLPKEGYSVGRHSGS